MTEAEAIIKSHLDGWFFVMDHERGKVRASQVPHNFIPTHTPVYYAPSNVPHNSKHKWTAIEDSLIIALREEGCTWREVSKELRLSTRTVADRYIALCKERNLVPFCREAMRQERAA